MNTNAGLCNGLAIRMGPASLSFTAGYNTNVVPRPSGVPPASAKQPGSLRRWGREGDFMFNNRGVVAITVGAFCLLSFVVTAAIYLKFTPKATWNPF